MNPRIIFLSHMFPNSKEPLCAPFMSERAGAISRYCNMRIVAPVASVPFLRTNLPPKNEVFNGIEVSHPRYLGIPSFLWKYRWLSYYWMLKFFWMENEPDYEIAHIEWIYPDAYTFLRYSNRLHIKTVGVVHGNEAIGYFEKKSHLPYYIDALQRLDRIIAVSADMKCKMIADYGIKGEKIDVIPNGTDLSKFPIMDKHEARRILALPEKQRIGVCVARLSPEKNLDILIEAISLMGDDAPIIYIIGDGPLKRRLEKLLVQHRVAGKIKLIGPVPHDKIFLWLNAGDFFCLPSQREGCPVVIHEALACGLPVISTTVGGIPEQICCDDYGLLCPPLDPIALSSIILKAMGKPWERENIAAYGRQFTWDSVAQQTIEVFKDVLT